jgi:hypothetical protein
LISSIFLEASLEKNGYVNITSRRIPYERPEYGTRIRTITAGIKK